MAYSIRDKQIEALKLMLNFNNPLPKNTTLVEPSWKVLVYDKCGQNIISPLLSVKDLRDLGVTVNLLLDSERDKIQDVPAIYFISAKNENIQRLCKDIKSELYESYYLNFISPIPRSQLEEVAQAAIESDSVAQIQRVYDQYLNFISLEDELFYLKHEERPNSFYDLNRGEVKDVEMEVLVNAIVDSLFSVFVTLGTVPIIRCPRNSAAEIVAEKLDKKLRDNLRDARNNLFANENLSSGQLSFQRPLLVIMDRNFDLATPLHHTWTYQALMHDTLDLKLNRVQINEAGKAKTYDLVSTDKLWKQLKGSPFPCVAEKIQEELEGYKQSEDEIKKLKKDMGMEGEQYDEALSMLSDNTNKLTSAISSMPELLEKKRMLDMHTNVATALLEQIKKRKLDLYFETEEKIMTKTTLEKSIVELINDPDAGSAEDKLRLLVIYYICSANLTPVELDQYLLQLRSIPNCDTECFKFLKRYKAIAKMYANQYGDTQNTTNSVSMFSNLLSKSSKFVMEGVKNLVVKEHKLPLTKIVDNLVELKSSPEIEDYRYFDPKLIRSDGSNMPRTKTPFNDAIVFLVGGGNYIEYQNLLDNAKTKSNNNVQKRIIYGCTDFVNASDLLRELTLLGKEIN